MGNVREQLKDQSRDSNIFWVKKTSRELFELFHNPKRKEFPFFLNDNNK